MDTFLRELFERLRAGMSNVSRQVPEILSAPREHPQEAMLLAALASLVLILVGLVAYVSYHAIATWVARRRMGLRVVRHGRITRIARNVLIVGLVAAALMLLPGTHAAGKACGGCHETQIAVDSWSTGSHSGASCYDCHARPGVLGAASATLQGVARIVGSEDASSAPHASVNSVNDAGCLGCHEGIEETVVGRTVLMRHADVIDAGMTCLTCHPSVGHDVEFVSADRAITDRAIMSQCLTCHDDVRASAECDTCHKGHPLDRAAVGAFGQSARTPMVCTGCHTAETDARCVGCHGLELPHPGDFLGRHAGMSHEDPSLCARCHEMASSREACACHGDENVHGTYSAWFPQHGPRARVAWPGGCNCHGAGFCGFCHVTSPF